MKYSSIPGLTEALCAYSFFRARHVFKDRTQAKRKGRAHNLAKRIKDLSASGNKRRMCRQFIREARAKGFRGSFTLMVLAIP